jgi:hypothetical protein
VSESRNRLKQTRLMSNYSTRRVSLPLTNYKWLATIRVLPSLRYGSKILVGNRLWFDLIIKICSVATVVCGATYAPSWETPYCISSQRGIRLSQSTPHKLLKEAIVLHRTHGIEVGGGISPTHRQKPRGKSSIPGLFERS